MIAGLSMTSTLEVLLLVLPFPVALICFLLCKERRLSGWPGRVVLIVQAGYFVLHMILFRTSVPWLNLVVFVWDTLFLLSVLFGFEYRRGYGVPLYRASSFWISVAATALYEVYGIWNVCTAAGVTDASEAFARVMVGELCFMILLLVLTFKTETKTVP